MINSMASILLYVPFNQDYVVEDKVKNALSEYEFFENCFVNMDIKKEIERVEGLSAEEFEEEEGEASAEELKREKLEQLKELKDSINNFNNWIADSGNAVYCIKGDAGCGKSTYLHYLKYQGKKASIKYEVIDIQKSRELVDVLNKRIHIPNFGLLDYKVISAMLDNILNYIFVRDENGNFNFNLIKERLYILLKSYKEDIRNDFPINIIKVIFEEAPFYNCRLEDISKKQLEIYADNLYRYLFDLMKNEDTFVILDELWNAYMCLLRFDKSCKKHIIAFDNFERFIGSEEISNTQLWEFVEKLRHLLQSCEDADREFYQHFQMILFMRNTTSRMGNLPLQLVDFDGHELDLSNWFPIDRIIEKKLNWYSTKSIEVPFKKIINLIFGKESLDGKGIKSIQTKLSMLFNNNKRTIIRLLSNAFLKKDEDYFEKFFFFAKNSNGIPKSVNKFAVRSIIMRLVLDELQRDNFFKNILVENDDETFQRLGIARKLLIILHNYSHIHGQDYMLFDDMIMEFRNEGNQSIDRYFDENYKYEREFISKILYYMNYYNSRSKDWIHFIDIQYNVSSEKKVFYVKKDSDMEDMIKNYHSEIGIRIMPAGKAYLHYIVQSFEYFACRFDRRKCTEILPLWMLLPNKQELLNVEDINKLECIRVIDSVMGDVKKCIERMSGISDNERIMYKRTINSTVKNHHERIIDSHIGYINNFQQCVRKRLINEELSDELLEKIDALYYILDEKKRKYEEMRSE